MSGGTDLDQARAVRDEDSFDVHVVAEWLRENAEDPAGLDGVPEVRQFTGGVSNLTYLLRYPEREVLLRRPPAGSKASSAHGMRSAGTVARHLHPIARLEGLQR
ncbi:phosphotransferase family protein [Nocardia cyriacigeorgica]|uniref:phosphotransferase family protein n=1 Tax=Nocardia cyriacigeorgica TaxID=135487 RepID=UPI003D7A5993